MRRKHVLFIVIFLLCTSSVLAYSEINIEPIDNKIDKGELATYSATITNEQSIAQTYDFYYLLGGLDWQVTTRPASDRQFILAAGETKTIEITVRPIKELDPGIYAISPVIIETDKGELYKTTLRLQIGLVGPQGYAPEIKLTLDLDASVDPRETQNIRVTIENLNPLEYGRIVLRTKSEIEGFTTEQEFSLGALEKKIVNLAVTPNRHQQPKDYSVFFIVEDSPENIVTLSEQRVTIQVVDVPFDVEIKKDSKLLKTTQTLSVVNDANTISTRQVSLPIGIIGSLFTKANPSGELSKVEGKRSLVWNVKLAPEEQATIQTVTNFRIPVIILFLIIILVIWYYLRRNEVVITKSAGNVTMHEGGVSGLKITLMVKNISGHPTKDVQIIDTLPGIVDVEKELEMGTLRPSTIKRRKNKTEVIWKLTELEGHEERLISYRIKSKLNIVGTLTLPRAKAKFKNAKGSKKQSFSNTYSIGKE